jgi:hypothetical protein
MSTGAPILSLVRAVLNRFSDIFVRKLECITSGAGERRKESSKGKGFGRVEFEKLFCLVSICFQYSDYRGRLIA